MRHYLGIDIGTFESKGVLVDANGEIVASAAKPHKMIVPQPGWAEHRPREDWWDDLTFITHKLLADSNIAPSAIRAIGCSAHRPLHAAGRRGWRAADECRALWRRRTSGEGDRGADADRSARRRFSSAAAMRSLRRLSGPKILWLKRNRPGDLCEDADDPHLDVAPRRAADRRCHHRPLLRLELGAALRRRSAGMDGRAGARTSSSSTAFRSSAGRPTSPAQ